MRPVGVYGDLRAWIEFDPALYCMGDGTACRACDAGNTANHGRGHVRMRWVLAGDDLAVQFVTLTGWHHPKDPMASSEYDGPHVSPFLFQPLPADLGFHSNRPVYDGMENYGSPMACDILGGECYYDGSGLNADPLYRALASEGDEAVWERMHDYFTNVLEQRREFEAGVTV